MKILPAPSRFRVYAIFLVLSGLGLTFSACHRVPPVNNNTYQTACGECHFAFQPALLPSGSWEKIIAGLKDHFGQEVGLDQTAQKEILAYLTAGAADLSDSGISQEIMKSLAGQTPLRVTDVPYIQGKHQDDDITPEVINRKKIGTLGNCVACHTTAAQGDYKDDNVQIPK